jgi:hypothetical protein
VVGYRLFRNGTLAGRTSKTSFTFSGNRCKKRYRLSVQAFDPAGNFTQSIDHGVDEALSEPTTAAATTATSATSTSTSTSATTSAATTFTATSATTAAAAAA